jgi:hypothetical protein
LSILTQERRFGKKKGGGSPSKKRNLPGAPPVSLPEDYCELFRRFGGGGIDDTRPNRVIPTMTFWTWSDMKDLDATVDFFEDCPHALPFGDDIGDMVYF